MVSRLKKLNTPKKRKSIQTSAGEILGRLYSPRIPDGEYLASELPSFQSHQKETVEEQPPLFAEVGHEN